MLDELIRAALNEAAARCAVPDYIDERIRDYLVQAAEPGARGTSDE